MNTKDTKSREIQSDEPRRTAEFNYIRELAAGNKRDDVVDEYEAER